MRGALEVLVEREDAIVRVLCPALGVWRHSFDVGQLLGAAASLGELLVLGRPTALLLPASIAGTVTEVGGGDLRAELPRGFRDILLVLDVSVAVAGGDPAMATTDGESPAAVRGFRAPTSGRFYSRPEPSKPPFVTVGDEILEGQPICMLEVMKTFSRVRYEGPPAVVKAIKPDDGDDLESGDLILELE